MSIPFEVLVKEIPKNKNNYKNAQWMVKNYSISYYPSLYSFNYFSKKFDNNNGSFIRLW